MSANAGECCVSQIPAAHVPIVLTFVSQFHFAFLADGFHEFFAALVDGRQPYSRAGANFVNGSKGIGVVVKAIACFGVVEHNFGKANEGEWLGALGAVGEVVVFVDAFAQIVAGGRFAVAHVVLHPFEPAVGAAHIRFDGAGLPVGTVVENGVVEARFEFVVRRSVLSAVFGVPRSPIGLATGGKFKRFHHFLRRTAVTAADGVVVFSLVAARRVVAVELVCLSSEVEAELEYSAFAANGVRSFEVRWHRVSHFHNLFGSSLGVAPAFGKEHHAREQGIGCTRGEATVRLDAHRQVLAGKLEVVVDELIHL